MLSPSPQRYTASGRAKSRYMLGLFQGILHFQASCPLARLRERAGDKAGERCNND